MGTKKKISLGDRASYFYIKNIKKWMFCPSCKSGKMTFNKKKSLWTCEDCSYHFSEQYFLNDCVFWFCDECEAYLNSQEGFNKKSAKHICRNCGYENDTTFDNVKGTCSDCGKILSNSHSTLCENCREVRRKRAKEWLIKAGKVVGVVAATVGVAALAASTAGDDDTTDYTPLSGGGDEGGDGVKMSIFKIIFNDEEQDEVFNTEEEAEEYALYLSSCSREGTEILHMSNPGDYDYDEDTYEDPEYEIVEVDD